MAISPTALKIAHVPPKSTGARAASLEALLRSTPAQKLAFKLVQVIRAQDQREVNAWAKKNGYDPKDYQFTKVEAFKQKGGVMGFRYQGPAESGSVFTFEGKDLVVSDATDLQTRIRINYGSVGLPDLRYAFERLNPRAFNIG